MNAQEVIDIMKIAIAEVEWNYPLDYAIAFEEAIKALEKQIPKIPVVSSDDLTDRYRYKCAVCGNCVVVGGAIYKHCPRCGQKLWAKE